MTPAPDAIGRFVYEPAADSAHCTVLAAEGVVAILHGDVVAEVLVRVWTQVSAEAPTLELIVQSIPSYGPGAVASFAVAVLESASGRAHADESVVSIVVRGDSSVDVRTRDGARRRFSSDGLQPWHLATFSSVAGLRLGGTVTDAPVDSAGSAGPAAAGLPLVSGVARSTGVSWILAEQQPAAPGEPQRRPMRVRVGASAPFELHVPVCIGRRPRGSQDLAVEHVRLVEVPSPTREVSGSHLLIEQRGDEVVATDLSSTNGTAVTLPGAPPIKLQKGDSIVLPPHSRIEIGDGNVIEILPGVD